MEGGWNRDILPERFAVLCCVDFGDNTAMEASRNTRNRILLLCLLFCTAAGPAVAQPQALVTVDPVIRQDFTQTVPILGRLVTVQAGTVAARVAGAVTEIDVRVGDSVTRGQRIASVDPEPLHLRKRLAESQRMEAETRIAVARAQLELARQEVGRLSSLQTSAAVSKAQIDDANQQQNIAFARVREAEAELNSADAEIRMVDLELRYTQITAPFDGAVTDKLTEVGSYLQRGQPVIRLVSDGSLELEADVPAARLAGLTEGRAVDITFEDGSRHQARVRAVVPEENPRTRTRRVRFSIGLDPKAMALAVQQSVTVHVPAGISRQISSVHKDAVIRKGRGSIVYVVEEGLARLRPVRLGAPVGNRLEVVGGLSEGERVVIRGNERLRPDQPVSVAGDPS